MNTASVLRRTVLNTPTFAWAAAWILPCILAVGPCVGKTTAELYRGERLNLLRVDVARRHWLVPISPEGFFPIEREGDAFLLFGPGTNGRSGTRYQYGPDFVSAFVHRGKGTIELDEVRGTARIDVETFLENLSRKGSRWQKHPWHGNGECKLTYKGDLFDEGPEAEYYWGLVRLGPDGLRRDSFRNDMVGKLQCVSLVASFMSNYGWIREDRTDIYYPAVKGAYVLCYYRAKTSRGVPGDADRKGALGGFRPDRVIILDDGAIRAFRATLTSKDSIRRSPLLADVLRDIAPDPDKEEIRRLIERLKDTALDQTR